jgi:hypothetical protein
MATAQQLYDKRKRDKMMRSMPPDPNKLYLLYIETDCDCCNRKTIRLMASHRRMAFGMAWDLVDGYEKHAAVTKVELKEPGGEPFWSVEYEYESSDG